MSSSRVVLSCAVMALTTMGGTWYVVRAFPMTQTAQSTVQREAGPLEKQANPITPENPIPARVDAPAPLYPAIAAGARGAVTLRITIDALGRVAESRPVGFEYSGEGMSFSASNPTTWDPEQFFNRANRGAANLKEKVAHVDAFVGAADTAVRQWRYEPPKNAPITLDVKTTFFPDAASMSTQSEPAGMRRALVAGVSGGVVGGRGGGVVGGVSGGAGSRAREVRADGAIRVGGNIKAPTKIRDVRPTYPSEAMRSRIQGVVIVEATIDTDGSVSDVRILRSIPMLDEAAVDAVSQWRFTPTLLNGQAVPVIMTMTVNFQLH